MTGTINSFVKLILTKMTPCMWGPFELLNILHTRKQLYRSIVFTSIIRKAIEVSQPFGTMATHLLDLQLQGVKVTKDPCYYILKSSPHVPQPSPWETQASSDGLSQTAQHSRTLPANLSLSFTWGHICTAVQRLPPFPTLIPIFSLTSISPNKILACLILCWHLLLWESRLIWSYQWMFSLENSALIN